MQRWKTLAPVEELAPAPVAACACGAAVPADWAYCARCGRATAAAGVGRAAPQVTARFMTIGGAAAVLAFLVGLLVGRGGGGDGQSGPATSEGVVTRLRDALATAERSAGQLQERNNALRKQLMDRHDEVARQLAERNDALRGHLKERTDAARKEIAERDASIGLLAREGEALEQAAAEETAALRKTAEDAEAQLKTWLEEQQRLQQAAGRTPPPASANAGDPAGGQQPPPAEQGDDTFWVRFDAEHPNVNGRDLWEASLRAALDELGPDHPALRGRAGVLFDENLARAEGSSRGGGGQ